MAHFTLLRTDLAEAPSDWLCRHAAQIRQGGQVLDVAAGKGRNARWLAQQGFVVEAVDRDTDALAVMRGIDGITCNTADLENAAWPYAGQQFYAIVVCRYLHRPLFPHLIGSLKAGGLLIYETFMQGHEAYGRPTNPEFLLRENELKVAFGSGLAVLAFEQGLDTEPKPAMMQRIAAQKPA